MDHAFLVGVLDRLADLHEQLEPPADIEFPRIAVVGDAFAIYELHHEKRTSAGIGSGIQHAGDVRVVHRGQRLALQFETGDRLGALQADPDNLERHLPAHRLLLFC